MSYCSCLKYWYYKQSLVNARANNEQSFHLYHQMSYYLGMTEHQHFHEVATLLIQGNPHWKNLKQDDHHLHSSLCSKHHSIVTAKTCKSTYAFVPVCVSFGPVTDEDPKQVNYALN